MMPPPVDQAARDRIRTDLGHSFFVEASAGTGKTTEIVHRIVAVLASGAATVNSIVVVTFTAKAAGELKLRLRGALEHARQKATAAAEKESLERALSHLEEARVSTIHSFCSDVLSERPVEAGIDPSFAMLPDAEAEQLFSIAFTGWMEGRLGNPTPALRRVLRRTPKGRGVTEMLRRGGWDLAEWRDCRTPWAIQAFDRGPAIEALVQHVHAFADVLRTNPTDPLAWSLRDAMALSDHITRTETVRPRDIDELEGRFIALADSYFFHHPLKGRGPQFAPGIPRQTVHQEHARFCGAVGVFRDQANAELAPYLQRELMETVDRYAALKAERGVLDFTDLILRARDLIRDDAAVRRELQERFTHIFVDEFQDTSVLQAELLLLLAGDDPAINVWRNARPAPGKLFIVGDPKQSIYRFRKADIRAYESIKQQLVAQGVEPLTLTTSFRSVAAIQRLVNAAFAPVMTGPDVHQPQYVPLSECRPDVDTQPAVVVVPVPSPYGRTDEIAKKAMRESIPDATAAFIYWLVRRSGWTVEEDGTRVPIAPRHICLLFRKYAEFTSDLTHPYVVALEARDIPHIVVGGRTLHGREEIETMRAALSAIEYPDDELSLYATLRGPLFAFPDAALFEYRSAHPLDYTRTPDDVAPEFRDIYDAMGFLRALHRARNARPVADTVMRLLEHTRAFANFVFRPSGEQVLANVLLIEELARGYDVSDAVSFRGFVEQLERDAERSQAKEAPTLEEGSEGVRMMTVHKAKGLEFPVVVLADLCAAMRNNNATEYVDATRGLAAMPLAGCAPHELLDNAASVLDEDAAEIARLTYVAATRARDLLVVTALGEHPYDEGWLAPLSSAIYPQPHTPTVHPHPPYCEGFGPRTTLVRPQGIGTPSVLPGAYRFGGDTAPYSVVWWDPARLDLGRTPRFGIRQDTLLTSDVPPEVVDADEARFEAWSAARSETIATGSVATLRIRRATDAAREAMGDPPAVATVDVPRPEGTRPAGPRFGTLVHAVLAAVPLDAARTVIDECAQLCGRILRSVDEDVTAAADAAERTLAHPLLARARAAEARGMCRRETPITVMDRDANLIEGIVDLAFGEDDGWTAVDFKTDADLEGEHATYERQVAIYAEAIAESTGQRCRGVLLRI